MATGFIQGLSKIATGTPAAFAATVTGSMSWDTQTAEHRGTGGQVVRRKGASKVTIEFEATGVAPADMALWFPTTAGEQVGSFPDFLVDDGDQQWILTGGVPGAGTIGKGAGETDLLTFSGSVEFALATPTSGKTAVYTTLTGYAKADIVASLGSEGGINSFEISNGAGTEARNPMDSKSAGALTFPASVALTSFDPTAKIETDEKLAGAELYADDYTAADLVIVCDNGVDTPFSITCSDVVQSVYNGPVQADGIVYYSYDLVFGTGNVFNRVTFAT